MNKSRDKGVICIDSDWYYDVVVEDNHPTYNVISACLHNSKLSGMESLVKDVESLNGFDKSDAGSSVSMTTDGYHIWATLRTVDGRVWMEADYRCTYDDNYANVKESIPGPVWIDGLKFPRKS